MNKIHMLYDHVLDKVMRKGEPIGNVDLQTRFMEAYDEFITAGVLEVGSYQYKLLGYQTLGGDCPLCGKVWKRKDCAPTFSHGEKKEGKVIARYHYFIPDCECIPICPTCGSVMWAEYYEKLTTCTICETRIRCRGWIDKYVGKAKHRERCKGYYRPSRACFICDECGDEKYLTGGYLP